MRNYLSWVCCLTLTAGAAIAEDAAKSAATAKATKGPKPMSDAALIKMAMSAAPADVSKDAAIQAIQTMGADMKMRQLRVGTNGWMCMVGKDVMCADKEWQGWVDAWMSKKDPQVKSIGIAYMLRGDHGASNTDPYAKEETPDNNWVKSPPHIMVLSPDTKLIDSLPTDPNTGGPWVMWKGTKYAHIMVPVAPMSKQAVAKTAAK
jgi:hypothetical protein